MRWEDVSLTWAEWRIPQTKAGRPHLLPLPQALVATLQSLPRVDGNSYMFPGQNGAGHLQNMKRAWDRIRVNAGIQDVRFHDLRRTVGSWLANAPNMPSSVSTREKRRRNPLSRRNSRFLSWRRVYRARSYCPGVRRLCLGGPTGTYPTSTASCRVSWPSYARSINRWIGRGMLPKRCASVRPSDASWAGPGDRATGMAVRASAATL